MDVSDTLSEKFSRLLSLLEDAEGAVLAYSGGVDSSFLLRAMKIAGIRTLAVTGNSETVSAEALRQAVSFAEQEGMDHKVILTGEMRNESFVSNPPDRCFFCKQELFQRLRHIAEEGHFRFVFDGSNADDLEDYRPGRKAAELYGVRSPLAESGLSKQDIRLISRELGLKTWDRPGSPCLSSRFPYGERITLKLLKRVERSEEFLRALGIETVRVRVHGDVARIEVTEQDMPLFFDSATRRRIIDALLSFGFRFISLDLEGFRSGSMNRVLPGGASESKDAL
jgi:uncharacterized protein